MTDHKLPMSDVLIVQEYKNAKQPMKQIGVLADLNNTDKKTIVEILLAAHCDVPKNCLTKERKAAAAETAPEVEVPEGWAIGEKIEGGGDANCRSMIETPEDLRARGGLGGPGTIVITKSLPKDLELPENLKPQTRARIAFADAIRKMIPGDDSVYDIEDIDTHIFVERVAGMVIMLEALEESYAEV